jgi:hypothetical protein
MELHDRRRERFKLLGNGLTNSLAESTESDTDTEIQGKASEKRFRDWLNQQLPSRFRALNGTVLSVNNPPCTERDCLIFDVGECPSFRQSGGQSDMFPVEGVIGSIELNLGKSGTGYTKLMHDCEKLSKVGILMSDSLGSRAKATKLSPLPNVGSTTIEREIAILQQPYRITPSIYLFIETLKGNLAELTKRIIQHNKSVPVSASVSGAFALNKGVILHVTHGEGWNINRLPGFPLAYMEAEPWEVLLKMMTVIWNRIGLETYKSPDLGPYYANKQYFIDVELPRCKIIDDPEYLLQKEVVIASAQG